MWMWGGYGWLGVCLTALSSFSSSYRYRITTGVSAKAITTATTTSGGGLTATTTSSSVAATTTTAVTVHKKGGHKRPKK